MKQLSATLHIRIAWVVAGFLLTIPCTTFGGENDTNISFATLDIVKAIEAETPYGVTRDTNGLLIGLSIPSKYNDDRSLQLISEVESLRRLKINGTPSVHAPALTPVGIAYLERMSNLVSLEFACFQREGLNVGILTSASRLRQLREFYLYFSEAPSGEYNAITNMVNLTHLKVVWCSNFGDRELQLVTNLTSLTTLVLVDTGVSPRGTNVIKNSPSITNLYFAPSTDVLPKRER